MYNFHTYWWAVPSSQERHIQQSQNTKHTCLCTYSMITSVLAYSSGYGFSQNSTTLYSFLFVSSHGQPSLQQEVGLEISWSPFKSESFFNPMIPKGMAPLSPADWSPTSPTNSENSVNVQSAQVKATHFNLKDNKNSSLPVTCLPFGIYKTEPKLEAPASLLQS